MIRSLVMAIYGNDVAGYDKLTIPHPLRARLTERGRVNQAKLDALKENPEGLQIIPKRPPTLRGQEVSRTQSAISRRHHRSLRRRARRRPDGRHGCPARRWMESRSAMVDRHDRAGGWTPPAKDSPELAIRSLLARDAAPRSRRGRTLRSTGADMELLFAGAPGSVSLPASSMPRSSKCRWSRSNPVNSSGRRPARSWRARGRPIANAGRALRSGGNPFRRHPRRFRVAWRRGAVTSV